MVENLYFYFYAAILMLSQDRKVNMYKIRFQLNKNVCTMEAYTVENKASIRVW